MQKTRTSFLSKSILFLGAFILASSLGFSSLLFPSTASAAPDDLNDDIIAYQYYARLFVDNECGLKDDVKGGDIDKYNFYNVWGTSWFHVGLIAKSSDGGFNCGDYGSSTKTFTTAAAQALGLDASDPGELLCDLGYKQTVASSNANKTSCATSSTKVGGEDSFHIDGAGTNVRKYLLANSLKGKEPKLTDAMRYWSTFQDFVKGCSAKIAASGSYSGSVANIRIVENGKVVTKGYAYTDSGKAPFSAPDDIGLSSSTGECRQLIAGLNESASSKYVNAYQLFILEDSCGAKYTNTAQRDACVKGAQNASKLDFCGSTYSGAANKDARLACYAGQGNQGAEACIGLLKYTASTGALACIKGAQNANNPNYCNTQYPAPDNLNTSTGQVGPDTNKVARDACLAGQKNPVDGVGVVFSDTQGAAAEAGGEAEDSTSCAIPGVGWLVCPAVSFLADVADNAYTFLADNFLKINIGVIDASGGTYQAWVVMRNIANVAFVIAFLIIIFSQLTGQGITNYGIKKTLPRLIIAAILVNTSFFICQIAVDISNILGISIKQALASVGASIDTVPQPGNDGGNWAGIALTVLAGSAIAWGLGLSVLLPFLIGAVVALVMIFLILVIRQMLVVLLIVVAPLAFVAFLLPNTESWFTKWRKIFVALLLVFPMVGLLFGVAGLASTILKDVYSGSGDVIGLIIAEAIIVLPLFLLPSMLKASLNSAGSIGSTIQNLGKRAQGSAKSATKAGYEKTRLGQYEKYRKGVKARRGAQIMGGTYEGKGGKLNPRNALSRMNRAINENTGAFGAQIAATGIALTNKEQAEGISMEEQKIRRDSVSNAGAARAALDKALRSGDTVAARAAQNVLFTQGSGGIKNFYDAVASAEASGQANAKSVSALRENINTNHGQMIKQKAKDISTWAGKGGAKLEDFSNSASTWKGLSQSDMSTQTGDSLKRAQQHLDKGVSAALLGNKNLVGNLDNEQMAALGYAKSRVDPPAAPAARPEQREFRTEQIQAMGEANAEAATAARGGVGNLNDGDVVSIANANAGTPIGDAARQEVYDRQLIKNQYPARDPRTMPQQPGQQPPAAPPPNQQPPAAPPAP